MRHPHLFVLDLTYLVDVAGVEEHLEAHREYLRRHYADGTFIASGRKEPRSGGVVLAEGERADIKGIVATDPFTVHGVARYAVTEFVPTMTAPALADHAEPLGWAARIGPGRTARGAAS